jgi:hypothetical protein
MGVHKQRCTFCAHRKDRVEVKAQYGTAGSACRLAASPLTV